MNKRKQSPAAKEPVANKWKSPPPLEGLDRSYQVIAHAMKEIREREREQQELIWAMCARLGDVQPDGLLEAIDDLFSQKKVDELEAKNTFLHEKSKKVSKELKEEKEAHRKALDKLNLSLAFNQKLETYIGHTGDVVNKAKLFNANLAKNPVTAGKVILVLVDFAEKMEELLDEMRIMFDGLQPEVPPVAADNLPDILGEIPSLTGWGKEGTTETPTKPDQPGASEPTRKEEAPARPEPPHLPRTHIAGTVGLVREVLVNTMVGEVVRELEEERESGIRHPNANTTGPDRHCTDETGRANGGTDEGVTNATFKPHSRAHLLSYSRVLGAPFLPQAVGDHHKDSLQDSETRTHVPTSGINTNSFEHRHGYIGQPGSFW